MLWTYENIEARIWPNDHCPPHVTFICRADGWTARIEFSMVSTIVCLIDIKPIIKAPGSALINVLANQVQNRLPKCRKLWWETFSSVCLDNKRVERIKPGEARLAKVGISSGVVIAKSGLYESSKVYASVRWPDGTVSLEQIKE
jgi:hypothetical protein